MDRFERLTLEEDEEDIVVEEESGVEDEEKFNPELCLVGRFLTRRAVRVHMMKLKMSDIWNPVMGVTIKSGNNGRFLFHFHHHRDMQKVLRRGPWYFEKHMLILGSMVGAESPAHVPLYTVPFWVQIHNMPRGFMSEKTGKQIAGAMGEFLEYDSNNNSQLWRKYMRIRVMIDVRRPLTRTKRLKKDETSVVVQLKYERLGIYCYYCGLLGHGDDECDLLYQQKEDDGVRQWGAELRADTGRRAPEGEGRWLREHGQPWQANFQERERSESVINTAADLEGSELNVAVTKYAKEHNIIAELMKNPHILAPKKVTEASSSKAMNVEINMVDANEEGTINIEEKKRKFSKVTTNNNNNINNADNDSIIGSKGEKYADNDEAPFLRVDPGTQASREK